MAAQAQAEKGRSIAMKETINFGKLTDQQTAFLETVPWHLEQWPGDDDRLRVVWPSLGQFGRWFSRHWPTVSWDFIRPSTDK